MPVQDKFDNLFIEIETIFNSTPHYNDIKRVFASKEFEDIKNVHLPHIKYKQQLIKAFQYAPRHISTESILKILHRHINPYMRYSPKDKDWAPIPYPQGVWTGEGGGGGGGLDCVKEGIICNTTDILSCAQCSSGGTFCQHLDSSLEVDSPDGKYTLPPNTSPQEGYCLPISRLTEEINPYTTDIVLVKTEKNGWMVDTLCKYPGVINKSKVGGNCSTYDASVCRNNKLAKYDAATETFTDITNFDKIDFDIMEECACHIVNNKRLYKPLLPSQKKGIGVELLTAREIKNPLEVLNLTEYESKNYTFNESKATYEKRGIQYSQQYENFPIRNPCTYDPITLNDLPSTNYYDPEFRSCRCDSSMGYIGVWIHDRDNGSEITSNTPFLDEPIGRDGSSASTTGYQPVNACMQIDKKPVSDVWYIYGFYLHPNRLFYSAHLYNSGSSIGNNGRMYMSRYNPASETYDFLRHAKSTKYKAHTEFYENGLFGWTWNELSVDFPTSLGDRPFATKQCPTQWDAYTNLTGKAGITNRTYASPHCSYYKYGEIIYPIIPRAAFEEKYFSFFVTLGQTGARTNGRIYDEPNMPTLFYIPSDMKK